MLDWAEDTGVEVEKGADDDWPPNADAAGCAGASGRLPPGLGRAKPPDTGLITCVTPSASRNMTSVLSSALMLLIPLYSPEFQLQVGHITRKMERKPTGLF